MNDDVNTVESIIVSPVAFVNVIMNCSLSSGIPSGNTCNIIDEIDCPS